MAANVKISDILKSSLNTVNFLMELTTVVRISFKRIRPNHSLFVIRAMIHGSTNLTRHAK